MFKQKKFLTMQEQKQYQHKIQKIYWKLHEKPQQAGIEQPKNLLETNKINSSKDKIATFLVTDVKVLYKEEPVSLAAL